MAVREDKRKPADQKVRPGYLGKHDPPICPELDKPLYKKCGMQINYSQKKANRILHKCADDPFEYIFGGYVRTSDEKDRVNPRKTIPPKLYLEACLDHIHNTSPGDVCCITKSRQMMMTWLLAAYCSWEARFHPHARVMIQSKKSKDTQSLVYRKSWLHSRIGFIERALPPFMREVGLSATTGDLWYPSGSVISGLPQDPDAARSYAASLYLFDEACFQKSFKETYKAVLPMAKSDPNVKGSGGRIVIITTAKGNTAYAKLVEETEEFNYHLLAESAPEGWGSVIECKGITRYKTESEIRVLRCHYSADPNCDPENGKGLLWLRAAVRGVDGGMAGPDWQQEREMNFRIFSGLKVWPDWDLKYAQKVIYNPADIEIDPDWPIFCGFDWGLNNPTVLTVHAMAGKDKSYQFDEIVMNNATPKRFVEECKKKPYFEKIQWIMGDPSIWRKQPRNKSYDMTSIGSMFEEEGMSIGRGRNEPGVDMHYVSLLNGNLWQNLDEPKFMISSRCSKTIAAYRNLRRAENKTQASKDDNDEPEKIISKKVDEFDANKYLHLELEFNDPDIEEIMPNSLEWTLLQMEKEGELKNAYLG